MRYWNIHPQSFKREFSRHSELGPLWILDKVLPLLGVIRWPFSGQPPNSCQFGVGPKVGGGSAAGPCAGQAAPPRPGEHVDPVPLELSGTHLKASWSPWQVPTRKCKGPFCRWPFILRNNSWLASRLTQRQNHQPSGIRWPHYLDASHKTGFLRHLAIKPGIPSCDPHPIEGGEGEYEGRAYEKPEDSGKLNEHTAALLYYFPSYAS